MKIKKVDKKQQQQQQCGPWNSKALFVQFLPHWGTGYKTLQFHIPGSKKRSVYTKTGLTDLTGVG